MFNIKLRGEINPVGLFTVCVEYLQGGGRVSRIFCGDNLPPLTITN